MSSIPEHDVTKEDVLDIGILAEESVVHQALSKALYDVVAAYVLKVDGGVTDLCAAGNEKHALVIFKIINLC